MNPNADILFGYFTGPSYGCTGDAGGFSIHLKQDGTVIYKTYILPSTPITETRYHIASNAVQEICNILTVFEDTISMLPEHIDNGSCDGSENQFIFNGKKVVDWNIPTCEEIREIEENNPDYLKLYSETIYFENEIMRLFTQIADVFMKKKIKLTLHDVQFGITDTIVEMKRRTGLLNQLLDAFLT